MATYQNSIVKRSKHSSFQLYHLASLFFLLQTLGASGILSRLMYGEWVGKAGDKITQTFSSLLFVASLYLLYKGSHKIKAFKAGAALTIGLALFLSASSAWSIDPATSIRRGITYLFYVFGIVGMAGCLEANEFMDLLMTSCGICAIASLVLRVVSPADAIMLGSGELRGILSHKNILGQAMAAGTLASLYCMRAGGNRTRRAVVLLLAILAAAVLAKSATSLLTIALFCGGSLTITLFQRGGSYRALALIIVVFIAVMGLAAVIFPDLFLGMLGKDPTLTGRTELWAYVDFYISQRMMLGWGMDAFWSPANPAANQISDALGWHVPEAHNGIREILLEVGLTGGAFFLLLYVRNILLAIWCLPTSAREVAISSMLGCAGIFLISMSEKVLIDPSQPSVGIFFITGFMCERTLWVSRQRRNASALKSFRRNSTPSLGNDLDE